MANRKQDKFTVAYITKKNMVMMGVMKSRFPARQGRDAITYVSHTAFVGSALPWTANLFSMQWCWCLLLVV